MVQHHKTTRIFDGEDRLIWLSETYPYLNALRYTARSRYMTALAVIELD